MTVRLEDGLDPAGQNLIGVAHSRAASYYLQRAADDRDHDTRQDADELLARSAVRALARDRATRLFREPVRVGTPYQLVRGALAGPAHAGILVDAANSVFILDELHAYEPRRLGMILAMVRLWTRLGGKVGVVSATLPAVLADFLAMALGEQPAIVEPQDSWTWPVRHRLALRTEHLTARRSVTEISGRLRAGQSVLVVANNVADARELFRQLSPEVISQHGEDAATLLHSRFLAVDRAAIERQIQRRFEAGKPRRPGLLVATQTVEVSLNVDFDALHTSAAPLESLIQRFGRVNRLAKLTAPAPVVVHEPAYGPRRSEPASDYADGVYLAEPVRLAWQILTRHDGDELNEKVFGHWLDEIYATDWGQRWRTEVQTSYRHWDRDWLQFTQPFDNRDHLADRFDELFEGVEAVLERDIEKYRQLLNEPHPAAGRLLAAGLLLPVPAYGVRLGRWDKTLGVTVIDADYDKDAGLGKIHGRNGSRYVPGEVL
jgi:CRISPR-associated endonuclease/helicase Cas3